MTIIFADANILVKDVVSASLFDLNKAGLITLYWTPEIESEYIEHRARLRATKNGRKSEIQDLLWATRRIDISKKYLVPNSTPPNWFQEETITTLMDDPKYEALKKGIPDEDDIHVAIAAAFTAEQLQTTIFLATCDLDDLPQTELLPFNVIVSHPGNILEILYNADSTNVSSSLLKTCSDFKNPPIDPAEFLSSISDQDQFNNPELAAVLKTNWNIPP